MKPTLSTKPGLVVLVLGLVIFLAVATWLKTVRRTLMDIPMPMHAGAVTRDFRIDYDGQLGGSGSSSEMGSVSRARGGPRVIIVGFPASKKHRYEAMLNFDKNADDLTMSPPRVQIEPDTFAREGFIIVAWILDVLGFGLCLVGAAMVVFTLLRTKFGRFNSLPEPR